MGKLFDQLDDKLTVFIQRQPLFFVASAPLSPDGFVNLSPKGLDTFRILDPLTVAYLDLLGSGIETVAHLKENGRIVFMFCAFEGRPRILRLHGRGEVFEPGSKEFARLRLVFPEYPGTRAVIRVRLTRISDSCGWGVPLIDYRSQRTQYNDVFGKFTPEKIREEMIKSNLSSLNGLPGLEIESYVS